MKRLAYCFSHFLMIIIVSTFVIQRGFNNSLNLSLNLFKTEAPIVTTTTTSNKHSTIIIAHAQAQEYSSFEERIYLSESFIDPNGQENIHNAHGSPQDLVQEHDQYHQSTDNHIISKPHFHQQYGSQLNKQQHPTQQHQPRSLADSAQQVFKNAHGFDNNDQQLLQQQRNTGQYHFAHTQIQWRQESTADGELSEFYLANYQASSSPSYHEQLLSVGDHLTYIHHNQQHRQIHHQHHHYQYQQHLNHLNNPPILVNRHPRDIDQQLISDQQQHQNHHQQHQQTSLKTHGASSNSNVDSFSLAPQHYHYENSLSAAIRHYWREVGGLCIASAIFLNWLFLFVKRRLIGPRRNDYINDSLIPQQDSTNDSAFEENVTPMSLDDIESSQTESSSSLRDGSSTSRRSVSPVLRQRSSTLKAENTCCASSGHASLSQSTSLSTTTSNTSEYISRYSSDFDSIQRLGRGGFGIVFEARNKIDDCHYAVKRICLPLEKEARERVMREVRALAKLDHAGIVRYYNAWLETPPDDWLKQHDAQLGIANLRTGLSFPSTDGEWETKGTRRVPGESGDNTSDWFHGDNTNHQNILRHRRTNGYSNNNNKFLRHNSSSPSLDIVFEGSGSIRLEAENSTKETNSSKRKCGDKNASDSDTDSDSDFIQFKSKGKPLSYQKELRQMQSCENKVYLYIQMQLCRKDTLRDWLRTNCDNRDKTTIFDLFYQIVDAMEYVHSQDLIHRDLKPSNIFFSLDGTLKIGDFGLCRAKTNAGVGSSLDLQEYVAESEVERGFDAVHTEQVGTQLYMSPEQLNGLSYNQKVDVFAMGLILLELLVPFKTQMQRVNVLFKARNNLYSEEFKRDYPKEHELVRSLLSRSPQKRPSATEIKQHELLANAQLSQPVIERIYHRRRTISSNSSTE